MFNRRPIPRVIKKSKHGAPSLTLNAQKYFESDSPLFHGTGKSGLTPLNPTLSPSSQNQTPTVPQHQTSTQIKHNLAIETYQRSNLVGFTADELYDLEATSKAGAKEHGLTNEIHPVLKRENWREGAARTYFGERIERSDGRGCWDVGDDKVWELLVPALRIASRLISNAHIFPWLDALFNGPRKEIRPPRCPRKFEHKLQNFDTRPPWVSGTKNDFNAERNWDAVQKVIAFNLHSSMEISVYHPDGNMMPNMSKEMLGWTGHTVSNKDDSGTVIIHLAIEAIEPLLDPNITQSERLLTTFLLARTLAHELCHASNRAMNILDGLDTIYEPYFNSENVSELGYSFENAIFGGKLNTLPGNRPELLNNEVWVNMPVAMTTMTFPNFRDILGKWGNDDPENANVKTGPRENAGFYFGGPDLNPSYWDGRVLEDTFTISITWIEDIQQDGFWDALVAQYGSEMVKIYPLIIGIRDEYPGNGQKISHDSFGPDYIKYLQIKNEDIEDPEIEWPGDLPRELWNRRILRARAIASKIEMRRKRPALSAQEACGLSAVPLPAPTLSTPFSAIPSLRESSTSKIRAKSLDRESGSTQVSEKDLEDYDIVTEPMFEEAAVPETGSPNRYSRLLRFDAIKKSDGFNINSGAFKRTTRWFPWKS